MAKVRVEQGWLEGEQLALVTGDGFYYSFKGVPYAAPPVGNLRFRAPQPPLSWEGVKKATQHQSVCPQFNILQNKILKSSEDCLYLNVYTPDLKPKHPLPVMVFIHGGGYKSGSGDSDTYGPDFLTKEGLVLVTINYRLEVLGFLSLENSDVPGNAGMKDQVAALRWIKNNISNFGGDPNNVTVFGESAGASSVGYHILSPMSKGLFRRAILISGSPLCDWTVPYAPRRRAFMLGKQLGKNTNDEKELAEYFRDLPVEKLLNTDPTVLISETLVAKFILKMFHHTPVVEKNTGSEQFLTDTPENLLKKGDLNEVDIMIGYTSEEALFSVGIVKELLDKYEMFAEMLVPKQILQKVTPDKALEISDKIRAHYFGNRPIDENTIKEMIRYVSDSSYVYDIHRFLKLLPRFNDKKRFLCIFSCVSERNIFGNPAKAICPALTGTSHLDDLWYLFDPKHAQLPIDVNSKSYKMIKQTSALFANFAKYGNPTPANSELGVSWPQYDVNKKNYLEIGETLVPGRDADESVCQFWQSIYDSVDFTRINEGSTETTRAPALTETHGEAKVKVEQGWLEGRRVELVTADGSYYSFKGIPYAAPPLGKLRFMAPQPPVPWEGVKDALDHGSMCPQYDYFTKEVILPPKTSENCLHLNVYSPDLKPERPLPVMFFIHGGGYKSDSGDVHNYGPDFLMKYGIVLVTINYRLDALGFLSLENDDVPGNAGMKDQVAALRWVRDNIVNFGGDPGNVTIFGESAGGASVGYHILSPMSKGLFQRAILMSGVPFCDWSTSYAPRRRAFALGKQLGKYTNSDKELLEFLQSVPVEQLVNRSPDVLISETLSDNSIKMYHFTPVVELANGHDHFLTDTPENHIKKGHINDVDIMIGHTDQEALFDVQTIVELLNTYETFPELLVPWKILLKERPSKILELSDKIKSHYFGNKTISRNTLKKMIEYVSDSAFVYDIHNFLSSLPQSSKRRYLYQFSAVSERNIYSKGAASVYPDLIGAGHLEDLVYLFDPKHANLTIDVASKSYKMIKQTCSLFANFAKYGNPTPLNSDLSVTWQQYQLRDKHYLDIGDILKPGKNLKEHVIEFWQSIYYDVL